MLIKPILISHLLLLFTLCFQFQINLTCQSINSSSCTHWQLTGAYNPPSNTTGCFPETTQVLTHTGLKPMKDLLVGDMVLGFNPQAGRNEFSEVTAWLHRDTEKSYEYVRLEGEGVKVEVSEYHNVAVVEGEEGLGYVFGGEVEGRELWSQLGEQHIIHNTSRLLMKGVYAPYTSLGNFYIANSLRPDMLFLMHSFAHITNPQSYKFIFGLSVKLCGLLGLNQQPRGDTYKHPLAMVYTSMFPRLIKNRRKEDRVVYYSGYQRVEIGHGIKGYQSDASDIDTSNDDYQEYKEVMQGMLSVALSVLTQPIL